MDTTQDSVVTEVGSLEVNQEEREELTRSRRKVVLGESREVDEIELMC